MSEHHLAVYLRDHHAGASAVIDLLGHLEQTYAGTDREPFFACLRKDVSADRIELEEFMQSLGVPPLSFRAAASWLAEKAVRVKLGLDDRPGGSMHLLEALELVTTGIEGKHNLWLALEEASRLSPRLRRLDFGRLEQRAVEQRQRVEPARLAAARAALP